MTRRAIARRVTRELARWLAQASATAAGFLAAAVAVAWLVELLLRAGRRREIARLGQLQTGYLRAYREACAASPILSRSARR